MWRHSRINTRNYGSKKRMYEFGEHFRQAYLKYLESSSSSAPPWVDLPLEITMDILQRVGTLEILQSAQAVCTDWWNVCQDPCMWHVVDLKNDGGVDGSPFNMFRVLDNICRMAVDRSQGQLLKISIENFGDEDLITYIAERSSQLRHLRLVKYGGRWISTLDGDFFAAAKNFPLLEELHIHYNLITKDGIEIVGRSCPLLKSFILNAYGLFEFWPHQNDDQALAIARTMPELRHLALLHNDLTNYGLQAILDGCSHLESLDLRGCCNIELEGDLGRRCGQQIVDLKHSRDSTDDHEFETCYQRYSDNGARYYSDYHARSPLYYYYGSPRYSYSPYFKLVDASNSDNDDSISFDTIDEMYMDDYHEYD